MSISHTAEQMAIAVLRGDEAAALALADLLTENHVHGEVRVPPIKDFRLEEGTLRVVLFTNPCLGGDVRVDIRALHDAYNAWLRGEGPLIITGMEADIYLLPNSLGLPKPSRVVNAELFDAPVHPNVEVSNVDTTTLAPQPRLDLQLQVPGTHPVRFMSLPFGEVRIIRLDAEPTPEFLATCNTNVWNRTADPQHVVARTRNARWQAPFVVVDLEPIT